MYNRFVHRDWQCVCLSVFECHFRSRCPLAAATHCELKFHILSWKAPWHSSSPHLHCSSEPAPWTCGVRRWFLGQFPRSPAAVRSRCRRASDPTGRLRSSPSSRFLYQDQAWLFVFCTSDNTTRSLLSQYGVMAVVGNSESGSAIENYIRVIERQLSSDWRTVSLSVASIDTARFIFASHIGVFLLINFKIWIGPCFTILILFSCTKAELFYL